VGAYEGLRRRSLSRQYGLGSAILMRRGLTEWMNTCSSYFDAPASIPVPPHDETILPQGIRAELPVILAGMPLHRCGSKFMREEAHQKVKADLVERVSYATFTAP